MSISVIIPVYNESGVIESVLKDLIESRRNINALIDAEIIFVDDGSTDDTAKIIKSSKISNSKIISTPHMGLSHALYTGIMAASKDIIVTIDADGQFSFEDIPRFLEKLESENADIVTGYRIKRNDNIIRKISSLIANFCKRLILNDNVRDSTCTLKAFKREVRDKILYCFDGFHRFIPSFAIMNGLKVVEIPVVHKNRIGGTAKFGIINRIPDVIIDIFGVRWLKYKRFSPDSDERRFSFYPDIFFIILLLSVVIGLFNGYFRVIDDFWLYGSLNRFIGYDYSKSYGWENFIFNEIVPPLIRIIYASFMNIGTVIGVKYPLEWTNKVIGISILLLSYILFTKFFNSHTRRHLAKWVAFLIVFYGVVSSEIYSGLARSFSYILIPALLIAFEKRSLIAISSITLLTALLYPVLLPLFFIFIMIGYLLYDIRHLFHSILPIISGLLGLLPMLLRIDLTKFSPPDAGDSFLNQTHIFELPISSNLHLLSGSLTDLGVVEWINFNFLHQWILSDNLRDIIGIMLTLFFLLAVLRRILRRERERIDIATFFLLFIFYIVGLFQREYTDIAYVFKWGIFFSAVYITIGIIRPELIRRYRTIFILSISALISFFITHLLSTKFGFGVHEPGRQIQRAFAIIFPFLSSALFYSSFVRAGDILKPIVIFIIFIIVCIFYPQLKLVSPVDRYVIERISSLNKGSLILSHPLTANWIVSHTDKYSTIIDEQIRVTKTNPIRGSKETIMPTEMAALILGIYYTNDFNRAVNWCKSKSDTYILVEEYYYSESFFNLHREPYYSFVERNNPSKDFALLKIPLDLRHPITPEAFLISCEEMTER
ncbi:MAG: glycosyltransferase family 2 protein [Myxococcota bacterium]